MAKNTYSYVYYDKYFEPPYFIRDLDYASDILREMLAAVCKSGGSADVKDMIQTFGVNNFTLIPLSKFEEVCNKTQELFQKYQLVIRECKPDLVPMSMRLRKLDIIHKSEIELR